MHPPSLPPFPPVLQIRLQAEDAFLGAPSSFLPLPFFLPSSFLTFSSPLPAPFFSPFTMAMARYLARYAPHAQMGTLEGWTDRWMVRSDSRGRETGGSDGR